jgi:hypothetical protein
MKLLTVTTSAHVTRINLDAAYYVNTGTARDGHDYIEFGFTYNLPDIDDEELLEGVMTGGDLLTIYDNFESYDYVMAYVVAAEF